MASWQAFFLLLFSLQVNETIPQCRNITVGTSNIFCCVTYDVNSDVVSKAWLTCRQLLSDWLKPKNHRSDHDVNKHCSFTSCYWQ